MAALLLMGAVLTGCAEDTWFQDGNAKEGTYTMIVQASMSGEVTRALSLGTSTINATWAEGEAVTVYNVTRSAALTGSLVAKSSGTSTTLKGQLTGTIATGDQLKLKFLSPAYSTQDGTLEYIAAHCDYAEGTATVTSIDDGKVTATPTTFTNQQAIVKFTLIDKADGTTPINASQLMVDVDGTAYTVTPASATDELFVAVPAVSNKAVNLTATVNGDTYIYEKSDVTFANGQYYDITVKMAYDALHIPLTFEAKGNGSISFNNYASGAVTYTVNGGSAQTIAAGSAENINVNTGDKVCFYGDNATYNNSNFNCTEDCYIYGNIMSLINSTDYATATTLTANDTFLGMFQGNDKIYSHASKALVMPATTLTSGCYNYMFGNCENLTRAPELPATTLADYCYTGMFMYCTRLSSAPELPATTLAYGCYSVMFYGCTSLTSAPALPATTLAADCYYNMFYNCTSLTTAPELPATTLTSNCYRGMFDGCSNLNSVTCLATDISASNCTDNWLNGAGSSVTGTKTFYKHASMTGWTEGASGIPSGWTIVNLVINLSTVTTNITVPNGYTLTGTLGSNVKISIADGATVTLSNVTIERGGNTSWQWAGLNCDGDATIILADGTTNTVKGFYQKYPGIHIPTGYTLTIQGTGTLNASSNGSATGIGGGRNISCGNIIINGGIITASGGSYAAGIGSGGDLYGSPNCGDITINGGTITATGGSRGAGIGSAFGNGFCSSVTINGGTVIATGGQYAAGIGGGGFNGRCNAITISGGDVTATGGDEGSGIGGGRQSACGNITIENTVTRVTATKGSSAPNCIGAGKSSSCGTVTIGGVVTGNISTSPYIYPVPAPSGAINGKFTINDSGDQVYFSQGNLQATYNGSSWSWAFATNQWDYIGNNTANNKINGNGTVSENGTVDLFGWVGASNNWTGAAQYGITSAGWGEYGTSTSDALKSDWGNTIGSGWRTLTKAEWYYLFSTRTSGSTVNNTSNARYTQATINTNGTSVNGLILFPDNVTISNSEATSWGTINGGSSWETKCTIAQWDALEAKGCVFLPAAGCRYGTGGNDNNVGNYGYYWSSTAYESNEHYAYNVSFYENRVYAEYCGRRDGGSSVRLVRVVE